MRDTILIISSAVIGGALHAIWMTRKIVKIYNRIKNDPPTQDLVNQLQLLGEVLK